MKCKFSAIGITEITGKAQGTIIQKSYGGYQIRKLVLPVRRQTNNTQRVRNNFTFVQSAWRTLTNVERQTWIDNAPEGVSGFEFYSSFNLANINVGLGLQESWVAPVANPPASVSNSYVFDYITGGGYFEQSIIKNSGNNAFPLEGWTPSFRWTGWIQPSRYQYPRMNLKLQPYVDLLLTGSYNIYWTNDGSQNPVPLVEGWKCKYQERWINETTGQVFIGETIEVVYGTVGTIGSDYTPGHSLASRVLSGSEPNLTLVTTWDSIGMPFDPDEWEPLFYMTDWLPTTPTQIPPTTNLIPTTAIEFTMGGQMIIKFGQDPGDAIPPTEEGQFVFVNFNWKRVGGSQTSNDGAGGFEAENG